MKKAIISIIMFCSWQILNCQWQQTNGPEGGSINSIAINADNIFAGGKVVFLSTNNGNSWTRKTNGLKDGLFVTDMAFVGNNLFAGTNRGVFLSTDDGDNWTNVNNNLIVDTLFGINCIETNGSNIFVGFSGGIAISTNNGDNWTLKNNGLKILSVNRMAISNDVIVIGQLSGQDVQEDGVLLSTDNGESWTPVNNGLSNRSVRSIAISGSNIFAGTEDGLYISTNYGESWSLAYDIPNTFISSIEIFGSNIFVGTGLYETELGIFVSNDNGENWRNTRSGLINLVANCFASVENIVFAGTNSGVFSSTINGESWIDINKGLVNMPIQGITYNKGKIFAGTYLNGIFQSSDDGESWTKINDSLTQTSSIQKLASSGNNIFAILYMYKGLLVSTNNGDSWKNASSRLTASKIYEIAIKNSNIFAGTDTGLYLSTDNGETWEKIFGNERWIEIESSWTNNNVPYFTCFTFNQNEIIAGTTKGVFLSTNNGENWNEISSSLRNTYFLVFARNGNNIYAGTDRGILLSNDNGESWNTVYSVPDTGYIYVKSLAVINNNIFAVIQGVNGRSSSEVLLSTDGGESWREVISGLTTNIIGELIINGDNIFASTNQSVFKAPLSDFGIVGVEEATNELQNYLYCFPPYPIPATNIVRSLIYWDTSIEIEKDDIAVYDIYGNKVSGKERITIDRQNAFSGILTWDCSNVSDGIYLVRIIHGTKTWTLKVTVNK
ncbi:MAG: T9SS type A sorting domain-containing protein [bacterium]